MNNEKAKPRKKNRQEKLTVFSSVIISAKKPKNFK